MLNRKFLSIDILPDEIKLGQFCIRNNILYVLDLQTFHNQDELRKYLSTKRLKNLSVIGSLGGVHVIARSITLSSVGKVDFDKEIVRNIREHIPTFVKDENVLIKYQVLSTKYERVKETVDVLVAVAKESAVIEYIEFLRELSLFPSVIDAGNTSLFLPFIELFEKNMSTAVINIKKKSTDIVIVENGFPYFVSELDIGGKEFLHSKTLFHHRLHSVFDFYHSGDGGRESIQKIIITGENVEEVKSYLEKKFDFPVETADFEKNQLIILKGKFKNVSSYAHIIGLGLKKVYPALFEIDLIPDSEKESIQFSSLKSNLKRLSFSFLAIFSFVTLMLFSINLFYSLRVFTFSRRMKGIKSRLDEVYELRSKNNALREELSRIEPLIKNETVWDKVLFEISKLTPDDVWLESIKSSSKLKQSDDESVIKEKILYLEGEALEQSKIDRFVSKLEDSPLFKSVQINKIEKKEHISFKLKLSLR